MILKPQEESVSIVKPPRRTSVQTCRNCGHSIDLHYCPNCGQHAADHNISLWIFVTEFFEEFIRFDSKFLRTIIPLIVKPGLLTREWVAGKRVRYITPLKIYITSSAIAFLAIGLRVSIQATDLDGLGIHVNAGGPEIAKGLKIDPTDDAFTAGMKTFASRVQHVDPKMLLDHYLNHLPTASLLTVPIAAMLVTLLYVRRRKYYVEHLVFLLHFNAFCFLLMAITAAYPPLGGWAFLWAAIYLFIAMKKNYQQGWIKTLLKYGFFCTAYSILIALTMAATAIFAAFMATDSTPAKATTPPKAGSPATSSSTPPATHH